MTGDGQGRPTGYSPVQAGLHWGIAALICFQLLVHRGMERDFDTRVDTGAAVLSLPVLVHAAVGTVILALTVWRLGLLWRRGSPAPPANTPVVVHVMGKLTHVGLYGLVIALPLSGSFAWALQSERAAELHELAQWALFWLVLLHALGAFFEHVVLRNEVLIRILMPLRLP